MPNNFWAKVLGKVRKVFLCKILLQTLRKFAENCHKQLVQLKVVRKYILTLALILFHYRIYQEWQIFTNSLLSISEMLKWQI